MVPIVRNEVAPRYQRCLVVDCELSLSDRIGGRVQMMQHAMKEYSYVRAFNRTPRFLIPDQEGEHELPRNLDCSSESYVPPLSSLQEFHNSFKNSNWWDALHWTRWNHGGAKTGQAGGDTGCDRGGEWS